VSDQAVAGIARIPYFSNVPLGYLQELADVAIRKTYPKNAIVINEGDEAGSLFIIVSGRVQAFLSNESGRTVTLSTQEAGTFFGELSLFDGEPRSASIVTLEPTVCLLIPRQAFLSWLQEHPEAAPNIIRNLTARIRILTESVRGLALSDVYGRLVKALNGLSEPDGDSRLIRNRPSQKELASLVGCSREMITRIMADLARGSYIGIEGKSLRLYRKLPPSW
jgi:CRP/FNR family cyclic AMP-dependent transcriptional regulator